MQQVIPEQLHIVTKLAACSANRFLTRYMPMENLIDPAILLNSIYTTTLDHAILTFDLEGKVTSWNVGAERITGFSAREMIGNNNVLIFTPEDVAKDEPLQEMAIARAKGRAEDYRWHMRKDGSRFWADGVLTPLMDASGKQLGYLKIFRDITDRKTAEAEIHRAATTDRLTGLANRHAFELHAKELIAIALRGSQPMALHLIDLDRFKQINDSLGHFAGDLLQQAAQRMQDVLRESDFLARLGGDEFVVLQPGMATLPAGGDLALRLIEALSRPFRIGQHEVQIGGSVGIAVCPQDADDLDQLMKKADLALYRAKEEGKGRYHYFTNEIDALAHHKSLELAAIRLAVEKKQFWLAYQPRISSTTGQPLALEALLRCANPSLKGYPVERIIDLALEAGLMRSLSLWILRESCFQLRKWKDLDITELKMCVNLSSEDLIDRDMPSEIDAVLAEAGLQGADLEIEITERQALDVEKHGIGILHALRSRGISVDIDDFGTGYSALSYLRNLPVTAVKLDKSFLEGIPDQEQGCSVIKAIMDLSRALELEVVAEGVETDAQANFLKENHCHTLQGYLLSKPLAADEMTDWLIAKAKTCL